MIHLQLDRTDLESIRSGNITFFFSLSSLFQQHFENFFLLRLRYFFPKFSGHSKVFFRYKYISPKTPQSLLKLDLPLPINLLTRTLFCLWHKTVPNCVKVRRWIVEIARFIWKDQCKLCCQTCPFLFPFL